MVEPQDVTLDDAGSSPVVHPNETALAEFRVCVVDAPFEFISVSRHRGCSSVEQSATLRRSRSGVRITSAVPFSVLVQLVGQETLTLQIVVRTHGAEPTSGERSPHAPYAQVQARSG